MHVTNICNLLIRNEWDAFCNLQPSSLGRTWPFMKESSLLLLVSFFFITLWKSSAGVRGCFKDEESSVRKCLYCPA